MTVCHSIYEYWRKYGVLKRERDLRIITEACEVCGITSKKNSLERHLDEEISMTLCAVEGRWGRSYGVLNPNSRRHSIDDLNSVGCRAPGDAQGCNRLQYEFCYFGGRLCCYVEL